MTWHHGTDQVLNPRDVPKILRSYQQHHIDQGWGDIGYHYAIDRFGTIWALRPLELRGVHAGGANTGNLGIVFLFDGRKERLTKAALDAAVALGAWWTAYLKIDPKQHRPHSDFGGTECPSLIRTDVEDIRRSITSILRGA